jgi:GH25 family lysozyme M1 (1,4-beta-N-acetylmuramidase)
MGVSTLLPAKYAKFLTSLFGLFVVYVQSYGWHWATVPAITAIGAALGVLGVPNAVPPPAPAAPPGNVPPIQPLLARQGRTAMAASAQGIDVSAYQPGLTTAELKGFAFAFCKVTDGLAITDPNLKRNWGTIASAGIHRGGYHELQSGDGAKQAGYFLAAINARGGIRQGDMLAVVASDYPGVTDAEVKAWCDAVKAATGGHNPVLVYTDLSVAQRLTSCAGYPLWVAWPNPTAPSASQLGPWKSWHIWQWGTRSVAGGLGTVDADAYNGDAAEMTGWINAYKPAPPPPTARYVADGTVSLATLCAERKVQPQQVLWLTASHRPHGFGPTEATYFNGGDWTQPMPAGTVVWTA